MRPRRGLALTPALALAPFLAVTLGLFGCARTMPPSVGHSLIGNPAHGGEHMFELH